MMSGSAPAIQEIRADRDFSRLRLLSCDVDGVLTDGGLYYDENGGELRRFHVQDGRGIKALQQAGITVCIISASRTEAIRQRARALGIVHCFTDVEDKVECLRGLVNRLDLTLAQVAHVGDDVNDAGILQMVGVPITVANCVAAVLPYCRYITRRSGGDGAVREIADAILESIKIHGT